MRGVFTIFFSFSKNQKSKIKNQNGPPHKVHYYVLVATYKELSLVNMESIGFQLQNDQA